MRKIMSKEEKEKKQKKIRLIVGIFLISIMIFSTIGFVFITAGNFGGSSNINSDEEFDGRYWIKEKDGRNFYFSNNINSVSNIQVQIEKTLADFSGKTLYISADNQEILSLLSTNLGNYASRIQQACYGECEKDLPEKTCNENLIVWTLSEENRVYQENECIFIEGNNNAVDAFMYKILGFL